MFSALYCTLCINAMSWCSSNANEGRSKTFKDPPDEVHQSSMVPKEPK